MKLRIDDILTVIRGNSEAGRIVPPSGISVWFSVLGSVTMTMLAVLAVLAAFMGARATSEWSNALAMSVTVQVPAVIDAKTEMERIVATSPDIFAIREVDADQQRALLEPLVGAGLDDVAFPRLFVVDAAPDAEDAIENLRLRLAGEMPEAVLDDPGSWRRPMVRAARAVSRLGLLGVGTVLVALICTVILSAEAAIAANRRNIRTLRLIGATDGFIVRAFVRRITLRVVAGAVIGLMIGVGVANLSGNIASGLLSSPGFLAWVSVLALVPLVGLVAFVATRGAAFRALRRLS